MLALIQQLYRVEREAKERELAPDAIAELRRERSQPVLERIEVCLEELEKSALPRSTLGEATTYLRNQWPSLRRFVKDGRLAIDNNASERAMRRVAVGRKSWLFAGSPAGGRRAAIFYTLIASSRPWGVESFAYLRDVIERVSTHPASRVHELTPRGWKASRQG